MVKIKKGMMKRKMKRKIYMIEISSIKDLNYQSLFAKFEHFFINRKDINFDHDFNRQKLWHKKVNNH